jgi:NCAIR mutase (PurE)-related protein
MNTLHLEELLAELAAGRTTVAETMERLRTLPFESLGDLTLDHHRELRCGFPEVVFAAGKSDMQVGAAVERLLATGQTLLVTRVAPELARSLVDRHPELRHDADARALFRRVPRSEPAGRVLVVAAGTSDLPVAAEASLTAELFGHEVGRLTDVGVAGLHRLLAHLSKLREQDAIVVVAGMEGALPSVVGGLVDRPVVAVPTSVGYGASFSGVAALLGMLNSCSAGITVVNIDNGFGAGFAAGLIARGAARGREGRG